MQTKTIELINRYYAAFNAGDRDSLLALLADDVEHDVNQGQREVGRGAFMQFLDRMSACYEERVSDILIMASADGRHSAAEYVVAGSYIRTDEGLPPARGQKYRLAGGAFFEVRGGQIARVTNYYNLKDWLRQIGA
jgi:steroid delta-isomerase-like uncharacterized protein